MESTNVQLQKAQDAPDGYALGLEGDRHPPWRAQRGSGSAYQKVWSVELQSDRRPEWAQVDWEAVLDRIIEAYDLNDPVIADFAWPVRGAPPATER